MGLTYSTYFGLARVSDMGPEIKGWSVTDYNPEITSLILRGLTLHTHGGATPIKSPGYNYATPATPISPTVVENESSGGVLSPGVDIGIRFAYLTNLGLETEASPETVVLMSGLPERPDAPGLAPPLATPTGGALAGGTYVYALTKAKGTGETQASGIISIDVPFSPTGNSYVVPLTFDPISTYSDGTDGIKLYRSIGLTAEFSLVKTFTDTTVSSYTDDGTSELLEGNPPVINTFNKNKYLSIDWSNFSHPASATALRIYITNSPGVYGVNHLLQEVDLATPGFKPTSTNYLGSESLLSVWPKEFSQLPNNPGKIQLGTEATGAPVLTEYMNSKGYENLNFVLPWSLNHSTPIRGAMYYDYATDEVKVRLAAGYSTLATPGGTYIHSPLEPGGHDASAIAYGAQNLNSVAGIIANTAPGQVRKQVSAISYVLPTAQTFVKTDTASSYIPNMQVTVTPNYAGSWWEFTFNAAMMIDPKGAASNTATFGLELNGSFAEGLGTVRSYTAPATPTHTGINLHYATPLSSPMTVKVYWTQTGGEVTSVASRRYLLGKEIF